jgi:hypothetical protein
MSAIGQPDTEYYEYRQYGNGDPEFYENLELAEQELFASFLENSQGEIITQWKEMDNRELEYWCERLGLISLDQKKKFP